MAGAALAAGCATGGRVELTPVLEAGGAVTSSVFLIGDAGAAGPDDRVLAELVRQARLAPRQSPVVFLGDNVYPRGIPEDTAASYPEARRRLLAQAAVADSSGLPVTLVPGNHDWDRQGPAGWANVRRQGRLLEDYASARKVSVALQPAGGCPGPVVTDVGEGVRLVAIDTQWWLHGGARCSTTTEAGMLDSLRRIHAARTDRLTIMVGHHPFQSHGEHGGHFPWTQYLFPVIPTPIAAWAWLPIGWIYPLGRRLLGHRQDVAGRENRRMRQAIEGTFSSQSPFIYAAGHDHSLEVIRRGPGRFYLVSGSGIERHQTAVGRGDSTAYASALPGFMRVDLMDDRRVRLEVTVIDGATPRRDFLAWLSTGR